MCASCSVRLMVGVFLWQDAQVSATPPLWKRELHAAQLAITFLSAVPLPSVMDIREGDFQRASSYYPLAGYCIGGFVALFLWLPLPLPIGVKAALAVWAWLAITGMIHFDGTVDSADALLAMKPPEKRLEILHDVHVGAFGLATGILMILILWSLLSAPIPFYAPLVAAVLGRTLMLLPMNLYPATKNSSLGKQSQKGNIWIPLLLTVPVLLLPQAWIAAAVGVVGALIVARFAASRLGGGLNGDTYGLVVTSVEILTLCAYAWGH